MAGGPGGAEALERNLVWYGRFELAVRAFFWLPVAFLFFLERFGLPDALTLSALYFLGVVVVEVPSGWCSDRIGRVPTLRLGALATIVAHLLIVTSGDRFLQVAAGQLFLATGYAFLSGTDVTLHFDTLDALGRRGDYERRAARVSRNAFRMTTVAALAGGLLGAVDLRLPFVASLLAAVAQFGITTRFAEPPRATRASGFGRQVVTCLRYLRTPLLAWLFLYVFAQLTMEHLSFELAQPYLAEVLGETAGDLERTPLYSGVLVAVVSAVGSAAAGASAGLRRRVGLVAALMLLAAVQAAIVSAMAAVVSLAVVPLLALRSVQTAAAPVLVTAAAAPVLDQVHRATFLSLSSLAGRLGYGATLLGLSTADDLRVVLRAAAVVTIALFVIVAATAPRRGAR